METVPTICPCRTCQGKGGNPRVFYFFGGYLQKRRKKCRLCLHFFVTYQCSYEEMGAKITSVDSTPVFHDNSGIERSPQLELFDFDDFTERMRYVTKRPPYRKRAIFPKDATQLVIEGLFD